MLKVEQAEGIATLTLNRPDRGNAIDNAMADALVQAAGDCAADRNVRCVVLTGAGRLFCAGGDVAAMAASAEPGAFLHALAGRLHEAVKILAAMDKPLLTLVNGPAAGAGFGLAMLGDVVIAARSAHFTPAYAAIGLTPDGGLSWLLPRLTGLRRAQEVILTNRRVGGEDALEMGLLTRLVDDADLIQAGQDVAQRLAGAATGALGATRRLLIDGAHAGLAAHLDAEVEAIAAAGAGAEGREGIAAFGERRPPRFGA